MPRATNAVRRNARTSGHGISQGLRPALTSFREGPFNGVVRTFPFVVLLATLAEVACGGGGSPSAGAERGACLPHEACNAGLTCLSNHCVRVDLDDDGGADAAGPDAAGGLAGTGGASCRQMSQACAMTTDCCADLICSGNACVAPPQCRKQAAACAVTADCCQELICTRNVCTTPPLCRATGEACAVTGDCCSSLVCSAGICGKPARCGDDVCDQSELDTCCLDCGCSVGFACASGGSCANVGVGLLKFNIQNACPTAAVIDVRLFDLINLLVWPVDHKTAPFMLTPGPTRTFNIQCTLGSQICYGGAEERGARLWGVGYDGSLDCNDCCFTCKEGSTMVASMTCP